MRWTQLVPCLPGSRHSATDSEQAERSVDKVSTDVQRLQVSKKPVSPDSRSSIILQPPTPVDAPSASQQPNLAQNIATNGDKDHERSPRPSSDARSFKETLNAFAAETSTGQRTVNQYILKERLGSGNYATVELATDREAGEDYAVKEFSKSRLRRRAQSEALKAGRGVVRGPRRPRRVGDPEERTPRDDDQGPLNLALVSECSLA